MTRAFALRLGVLRAVLRRMFASRLGGFLNILVIGIALSLPAGMYALLQNAQGLVAQLSGTPQIGLFLEMNAKAEDVGRLKERLTQHPGIAAAEFVPRAEALEALRDELAKLPRVKEAQLDSAWAYKLEALLRFGRVGVLILACLLSLALIAVTFNTIRLQILMQRDEIEVAKLIGATDGFIRRPFLYFGAMQGLFGGVMAWLIVALGLLLLNRPLGELSQLYGSSFALHPLSLGDSLSLLLFSLYLGWLGAWLSVARHLSQIGPR